MYIVYLSLFLGLQFLNVLASAILSPLFSCNSTDKHIEKMISLAKYLHHLLYSLKTL